MSYINLVVAYITLSVFVVGYGKPAKANNITCIQGYFAQKKTQAVGIAPNDVELLIQKIGEKIGLSMEGITIIQCNYQEVEKAQSLYSDGNGPIPRGDYILYDRTWVREVIGSDKIQATALFGHELAHLLGRHFTSNANLRRIVKETYADKFAGCAVASQGYAWSNLENLLSRIRTEKDGQYPSFRKSSEAAREGYDACKRESVHPSQQNPTLQEQTPRTSVIKPNCILADVVGLTFAGACVPGDTKKLNLYGKIDIEYNKLSYFRRVEYLNLANTNIDNIVYFETMRNLRELSIAGTNVKSIFGISRNNELEKVNLNNTNIIDISELKELPNLGYIQTPNGIAVGDYEDSSNGIEIVKEWLSHSENLKSADCLTKGERGVYIDKICLSIRKTKVFDQKDFHENDIKNISKLINIEKMILRGEQKNFKYVVNLKNIKYLNLINTNINDLQWVSKLRGLEKLFLNGTPAYDYGPLKELASLHYIQLPNGVAKGDYDNLIDGHKQLLQWLNR